MATLLASFSAALGAGLTGVFINAASLFGLLDDSPRIRAFGVWMLVATFPLGWLVAGCLDAAEAESRGGKGK